MGSKFVCEPVLLRADNFAPSARTPWGGKKIAAEYKRPWLNDAASDRVIGESWEVSVEPDFPAQIDNGPLLREFIEDAPELVLGREAARGRSATALLVKLIDTADPLSVQIHPDDHYPGLVEGECGKPESWYVVDREPGAGLYLGFHPETRQEDVRSALLDGASLEHLLRFVPVEPGDFFVIDAGTPHAIGRGLTLVEPQHVLPGKRGVTYRYWDWGRRYNAAGEPDPQGEPRQLHIEHALNVTAWDRVREPGFVDSIRVRAGAPMLDAPPVLMPLAGPDAVQSDWLRVSRLNGTGSLRFPRIDALVGVTVLEGSVTAGNVTAQRGRSLVIPASYAGDLELTKAHALLSSVA